MTRGCPKPEAGQQNRNDKAQFPALFLYRCHTPNPHRPTLSSEPGPLPRQNATSASRDANWRGMTRLRIPASGWKTMPTRDGCVERDDEAGEDGHAQVEHRREKQDAYSGPGADSKATQSSILLGVDEICLALVDQPWMLRAKRLGKP